MVQVILSHLLRRSESSILPDIFVIMQNTAAG